MTLRIASGLAAGLARLIGLGRDGGRPTARDLGPGSPAPAARGHAAPRSLYVVAAPPLRCLGGWSVQNGASNRVIAAGLSRRQAETLRMVLDLACPWPRDRQADAVHRKEAD